MPVSVPPSTRLASTICSTVRRCIANRLRRWRVSRLERGAFAPVRASHDGRESHDDDDDDDVEWGGAALSDANNAVSPPSSTAHPASPADVGAPAASTTPVIGAIDCVICMTEVVIADRDYMVTPCSHLFHEQCLRQWMDVKMECPTCRALLPSP